MPKLPVLKDKDVIAILQRLGFAETRQKGSHKIFRHPDGRRTIVPIHAGRDIPIGTLKAILKDANIDTKDISEII